MPLSGDLARNLGTCPDGEVNRLFFSLQAGIQSIETLSAGQKVSEHLLLIRLVNFRAACTPFVDTSGKL